jgi:hypothetical protein
MTTDEPFGRQPLPVTVTVKGEPEDVQYWLRELMRRAECKGDLVQGHPFIDSFEAKFTIYPRAVND